MHHFVISAHCMATFFSLKRDVAANLADGVGMDVQALGPLGTLATNGTQERGDVLQVEQIHDAGTALHQQVVALAGRGAVEVEIARTELAEDVLGNDGTQLHRLLALVEKLLQLLARDPDYAAGHHRLDGGLRRHPRPRLSALAFPTLLYLTAHRFPGTQMPLSVSNKSFNASTLQLYLFSFRYCNIE